MQHVDEGTLHAVLDGEAASLGAAGAEAVAHLESCATCRARLEEERAIRAQADAILEGATPPASMPPFADVIARAGGAPARVRTRRVPVVPLRWAATIVVAVALGWFARDLLWMADERSDRVTAPATDRVQRSAVSPAPHDAAVHDTGGQASSLPFQTPPTEAEATGGGVVQAAPGEPPVIVGEVMPAPLREQALAAPGRAKQAFDAAAPAANAFAGAARERDESAPTADAPEATRRAGGIAYAGEWRQTDRAEAMRVTGALVELGDAQPAAYSVRADTVRVTYVLPDGEALVVEQTPVAVALEAITVPGERVPLQPKDPDARPPEQEARRRSEEQAAQRRAAAQSREAAAAVTPAPPPAPVATAEAVPQPERGELRVSMPGVRVVLRAPVDADSLQAFARRLRFAPRP